MAEPQNTRYQAIPYDLLDIEHLACVLKRLSAEDIETLEILLNDDTVALINQSIKELDAGEGVPIDEW